MTSPQPIGGSSIGRAARAPFDWMQRALERPKVLVLGSAGSGKTQYLASLPHAGVDARDGSTIAVAPSARGTVAQMAEAIYRPGVLRGNTEAYTITSKQAGDPLPLRVTLAELPDDLVDDWRGDVRMNDIRWRANANVVVGTEELPLQEQLATVIGFVFIIDPATLPHRNRFVLEVLQRVTQVLSRWREAGVSNLPSLTRRVPVALTATKADALEPGHALLSDHLDATRVIGRQSADGIASLPFSVSCSCVSAWGDGPGARIAGTRFEPQNVLAPIRAVLAGLPGLVRATTGTGRPS